eukprot:TRINITY_DN16800_c0_g1_i1.p1 TRINITY_DN16800_c0_g1~~TRINITY_DN16800_c0_g1_i1.p1  ORF type:complete len:531 (-),score=142.40 TRINITY_DN16800_c0_g1_i1:25-1617(-)
MKRVQPHADQASSAGQSRAAKRRKKAQLKKDAADAYPIMSQPAVDQDEAAEEAPAAPYVIVTEENFDSQEEHLQVPAQIVGVRLQDVPDSAVRARSLFEWIVAPIDVEEAFYQYYWEKQPFVLRRPKGSKYYADWIKSRDLKQWIEKGGAVRGEDYTITKVVDGERQNYEEKSSSKNDWDLFEKNGWSIRFWSPQKFESNLRQRLSVLEEEFSSMVGCNVYLTPKNSQGFAPHFDDIDAFILQAEGSKLWRVFAPLDDSDFLARFSSLDFDVEELGKPLFQARLDAGDLLFLPRGFIHYAETPSNVAHSLHITISTNQRNSVADLLELVVDEALQETIQSCLDARKALPRDYLGILGVVNADNVDDENREKFLEVWRTLLEKIKNTAEDFLDAGIDQIAKKYLAHRIPFADKSKKKVKLTANSRVCLIRRDVARLCLEGDGAKLYHCVGNQLVTGQTEEGFNSNFLEFDLNDAALVEQLLLAYPRDNAISIGALEYPQPEGGSLCKEEMDKRKLEIVRKVAEAGIIDIIL